MTRATLSFASLLLAGLLLALGLLQPAHANGVPQLVKLTYLEGISNFGPRDAEGVLEFSFSEAYARVDVKNLPPIEGYVFEGWLTGGAAPPFRVGTIPTRPDGIGLLETRLQGLASYDYRIFVVAARPVAAPEDELPSTISIAGRFLVINDDGSSPTGDIRPGLLPETGERPGPSTAERFASTAFTMLAVGAIAFVFIWITIARRKSA
jgi:hypothetical protein